MLMSYITWYYWEVYLDTDELYTLILYWEVYLDTTEVYFLILLRYVSWYCWDIYLDTAEVQYIPWYYWAGLMLCCISVLNRCNLSFWDSPHPLYHPPSPPTIPPFQPSLLYTKGYNQLGVEHTKPCIKLSLFIIIQQRIVLNYIPSHA